MPQLPWNTPIGVNYKHIAGAGTTVAKTTAGILDGIVVNSNTGTVSTIAFYDTPVASGVGASTAIGITGTLVAGVGTAAPFGITYAATYNTGLTIVTAGSADITVMYK